MQDAGKMGYRDTVDLKKIAFNKPPTSVIQKVLENRFLRKT
jgi:hypothetical protein